MQTEHPKLELPELKYGYAALEPVLISDILEVHHKKHHQAYVNNYNTLANQLVDNHYKGNVDKVQSLCGKVSFNAGGHNCHAWYWENLAPADNGGGDKCFDESSAFAKALVRVKF